MPSLVSVPVTGSPVEPVLQLRKPYLLYLGDVRLKSDAKTAFGVRDWCPDDVIGQWALPTASISLDLPVLDAAEASRRGAGSLLIGVAPVGGQLPQQWIDDLEAALLAGLDVVSGMHSRLADEPRLLRAAARGGARLVDVRRYEGKLPTGNGVKRTGLRILTVGTDCALGKKYTALALTRALLARGARATFRATGQTGILIAGRGIAIDAVVADFISGAAEILSPANDADHWDVIEGQGSLLHPAYAGVTLGLLHGSQPDVIVLCHDPKRVTIEGYPHVRIPPLAEVVDRYLDAARLTNADVCCAGISVNSSELDDAEWQRYRATVEDRVRMPVCDPMRGGVTPLVDAATALVGQRA